MELDQSRNRQDFELAVHHNGDKRQDPHGKEENDAHLLTIRKYNIGYPLNLYIRMPIFRSCLTIVMTQVVLEKK